MVFSPIAFEQIHQSWLCSLRKRCPVRPQHFNMLTRPHSFDSDTVNSFERLLNVRRTVCENVFQRLASEHLFGIVLPATAILHVGVGASIVGRRVGITGTLLTVLIVSVGRIVLTIGIGRGGVCAVAISLLTIASDPEFRFEC
ncbi:hypothetical protein MUK72_14495 (plasmid) [Halococcus dombrowskii]|uniref:Uncharacterized protein n=1 Tax=Halococcus dombrowskii TaxID=179637 RepID=A0AAX3ARL0_HALDO|nr:hypothetical protein [Halococcus dombrowskii]UOO96754.1 hypothetical protein MUK72_14495 [Halococcus dombrowskii]